MLEKLLGHEATLFGIWSVLSPSVSTDPTMIGTSAEPFQTSLSAQKFPSSRQSGTCVHCRRRKIKCDNESPCSNCLRTGHECIPAPPKRAPRRKQPEDIGRGREAELVRRLNKLEGTSNLVLGEYQADMEWKGW